MTSADHDPRTLLPLTPTTFHLLLALVPGERHGYGLMQDVQAVSQGTVRLGPGQLYTTLRRMLTAGLIVEADERPDPALDDTRRRYYRLTPFGRQVAEAEAQRYAGLVVAAQQRALLTGSGGEQ